MTESERERPLVSVITPSFNCAAYIEETIQSVLAQDYEPLEHIIIDGGSPDGTVEILKRHSGHVEWISEPDNGQSEALNKGFRMAQGEIIGWLNADDVYLPGAVKRAATFLDQHPEVAAVYSDGHIIDAEGRPLNRWQGREFSLKALALGDCFICQPTIFMRREALEKVGWLDEDLHYTMDYDLWLRLGLRFRLGYMQEPAARFRLHPASKTSAHMMAFHGERLRSLDRLFAESSLPHDVLTVKNEAYARAHLLAACHYYHLGDIQAGQKVLCTAAEMAPHLIDNVEVLLPLVIGSLPADTSPVPLVRTMFANLPNSLANLSRFHKRAETWAHVAWAFVAHRRGDYKTVRTMLWTVLQRDRSWLRNRGVVSIGLDACLGPHLTRGIRSLLQASRRRSPT